MNGLRATALVIALAGAGPAVAQDGVTVTFLANEGVLLSSGSKKVLIDALFLKYETGYAVPADSTQRALAGAIAPFDSVSVVLVTHRHGDHFHPAPVAAHLRSNARAMLLTSRQVIDSLRSHVGVAAMRALRVRQRTTPPGERHREIVDGVTIDVLGLPHGGRRHRAVEHLGYLVHLGGRRVLHVGDTDISAESFAPFRLDTLAIDVALLPAWMVTSRAGREVIERWIRPRAVVAFHAGADDASSTERAVRKAWPGAHTFVRSLATLRW